MIYLFCYDISDQKTLRKVSKTLENFGIRTQYSFFQAEVDEETKDRIKKAIFELIDLKKDRFSIYPMCERCAKNYRSLGTGNILVIEDYKIL